MKTSLLQRLYLLFSITLGAAVILYIKNFNPWLSGGLAAVAALLIFYALKIWITSIHLLVKKSNEILLKKSSATKWSFQNLAELHRNHELIAEKFQISAQLIANLIHPEKTVAQKLDAEDPVYKSLESVRSEMKRIKIEEERRAWVTQGLAKFSEVLRKKADLKEYGNSIISNLVKYLNINQGGLYIEKLNEKNDRYLELIACYAYGRKKYLENKIMSGEGLLGQCMLEKDFLFIKDIPKGYIKITSGLGEATPRNIVVAPLIFNDQFCGAIELASFEILQPHHLEFLKKVCDDIAAEIVSLNNSEHTRDLLNESNKLTQELQSREEEMRQNMEELAATQEEMSRKQIELSGIMNAIDSTLATVELDNTGKIIKHNSIFENLVGYSASQLKDKTFHLLIGESSDIALSDILNGVIKSGDFKTVSKQGLEIWLNITFTPVTDHAGITLKLLCMMQNITQKKMKEKESERRQAELKSYLNGVNNTIASAEFDLDGTFREGNEIFLKVIGYTKDDLKDQSFDIIMGDDPSVIMMWENLKLGKFFSGEFKMIDKEGKELWLSGTFNPATIEGNEPEKIIMLAQFTTQEKEKLNDLNTMVHALKATLPVMEFNADFSCKTANEIAMKFFGLSRLNLKSKTILDFIAPYYHSLWNKRKEEILENDFSSISLPFIVGPNQFNYEVTISIVKNLNGSISKVIVLLVKEVSSPVSLLAVV
ncbi:MAG TPA: hypothetical protein DGG95_03010 [Cytophagales bacterium]|jgi:PAS domain S-box-containing protein|nr:hypothetical protein [Cytophagales bacterium]